MEERSEADFIDGLTDLTQKKLSLKISTENELKNETVQNGQPQENGHDKQDVSVKNVEKVHSEVDTSSANEKRASMSADHASTNGNAQLLGNCTLCCSPTGECLFDKQNIHSKVYYSPNHPSTLLFKKA
jgi:hypothetical protein